MISWTAVITGQFSVSPDLIIYPAGSSPLLNEHNKNTYGIFYEEEGVDDILRILVEKFYQTQIIIQSRLL